MLSNNKKIVFFMTALQSGGGERVFVDVMNYMANKGHAVTLVVIQKGGVYQKSLDSKIEVISLNGCSILAAAITLYHYIKKNNPDIVISTYVHLNPLMVAAVYFARTKTKTIIRVGVPLSSIFKTYTSFKDRFLIPILTKIFYKRADAIVAVSEGVARDLETVLGVGQKLIRVIYSPKDKFLIEQKAKEYTPEVFKIHTGPFFLYVGRFSPFKDLPMLLEAFRLYREAHEGHLILVGDGGEKKRIHDLVEDYNLSASVSVEGNQPNPHVYMAHADVLLLSSTVEGLPNVLIEGLINTIPIVATDAYAGGVREIVAPESGEKIIDAIKETDSGYLTPVGRSDLFAQAMVKALERKEYSFNTQRFEYQNAMKMYEDLFMES